MPGQTCIHPKVIERALYAPEVAGKPRKLLSQSGDGQLSRGFKSCDDLCSAHNLRVFASSRGNQCWAVF